MKQVVVIGPARCFVKFFEVWMLVGALLPCSKRFCIQILFWDLSAQSLYFLSEQMSLGQYCLNHKFDNNCGVISGPIVILCRTTFHCNYISKALGGMRLLNFLLIHVLVLRSLYQ